LAAQNGSNYREPVWHCAVRAAPEDRPLSDAEWAQVAAAIMDRTSLAQAGVLGGLDEGGHGADQLPESLGWPGFAGDVYAGV
jgi:hypothetical protein